MEVAFPENEEHRTFDHEPVAVRRSTESVEEALQHVAREKGLEVLSFCSRSVEESLVH